MDTLKNFLYFWFAIVSFVAMDFSTNIHDQIYSATLAIIFAILATGGSIKENIDKK